MRWRALVALGALVVAVVFAYMALSTASPDALPKLPQPVAVSPTPTPTVSQTPKALTPRGNPVKVRVTRRGVKILSEPISGPVNLQPDQDLVPPLSSVAWFYQKVWPKPGFPGPSVLVGHIIQQGKHGVFWNLQSVLRGDTIQITYSSGDIVTFTVTEVDHTQKVDLPSAKIWNPTKVPELRLVTCDPDTTFKDGHFAGNILVYADQLVSIKRGSGGK